MKILVLLSLSAVATAFAPTKTASRIETAQGMSILDDWKTFFSPQEQEHRRREHEQEMEEISKTQKEILEMRRDPEKLGAYYNREERRHQFWDKRHDQEVDKELSSDWVSSSAPQDERPPKASHNAVNDWKNFFSKQEFQHRQVQHHLEKLENEDADQAILERRRNPYKMKQYKKSHEERRNQLDKQHDLDLERELSYEHIEGQDYFGNVSTLRECAEE